MANYDDKWPPLTSDPVLLNTLLLRMGLPPNVLLKDACLVDDLDDSTLALIILYPESKYDEAAKAIEEEQRDHAEAKKLNVCLIKQTIDNACGMFAIINAVLNSNARKDIGKY
jgi:ubiquitin carboxyl-terminal hydrolase L3